MPTQLPSQAGTGSKVAKTRHPFNKWCIPALASLPLFLAFFPFLAIPSKFGKLAFTYVEGFLNQSVGRQWASLAVAGLTNAGNPFGSFAQPCDAWLAVVLSASHWAFGLIFLSLFGWGVVEVCWWYRTRKYPRRPGEALD